MIDNKVSKARHRADNLIEDFIEKMRSKKKNDVADACEKRLNEVNSNEDYFKIITDFAIPDPVSGTTD
jgi:glycyl-tRNA synthetase (class II)